MDHNSEYEKRDKDDEQDLRNFDRNGCDAAKTK
jgi:hypothetical protein